MTELRTDPLPGVDYSGDPDFAILTVVTVDRRQPFGEDGCRIQPGDRLLLHHAMLHPEARFQRAV